jgi:hypothetical protein
LHCTGRLEDAAALLPDCPVLSDDALLGVRDGVLAVPMVAVGDVDPTERG